MKNSKRRYFSWNMPFIKITLVRGKECIFTQKTNTSNMQYAELLALSPVFRQTTPERIVEIMHNITWQVRRYSKGEMVAVAGEEVHYLMIVVEGSVKGEMTDASGRVIKIEDVETPRPIALSFVFGQQNFFPVNVTANEDSAILLIPKPDLLTLLQTDKQVLRNVLDAISSRAQFLSHKIRTLSMKSLKGKIAQMLLELSRTQGDVVQLPSTQTELADYFGVARPSLARTLGAMADAGIISFERKTVSILNKRKLIDLMEEKGG
ncbi:MAG: Crp/Fnr family transcriptional regulator [Bacteroidales bacterium]